MFHSYFNEYAFDDINIYPDEGVSQELATLRKQEIKELKYKLYFSIPEQKS